MQVLTGTKREIAIMEWQEQLEKYVKRINDSMECFRRFSDENDAQHIKEDAERLAEIAQHAKEAIYFMDLHGIK